MFEGILLYPTLKGTINAATLKQNRRLFTRVCGHVSIAHVVTCSSRTPGKKKTIFCLLEWNFTKFYTKTARLFLLVRLTPSNRKTFTLRYDCKSGGGPNCRFLFSTKSAENHNKRSLRIQRKFSTIPLPTHQIFRCWD